MPKLGWTLLALVGFPIGCQPAPTRPGASPTTESESPLGQAMFPRSHPEQSVLIDGVPHVRQKPDFCGEAATTSYLLKLGQPYDQDQVFEFTGLDPALGMGATTRELKLALERIGFEPGPVWYSVAARRGLSGVDGHFRALYDDLVRGVPSIVCTHYDDQPTTTEHFRLILGYDAERDELIYHEPAVDQGAYLRMGRAKFLELWPLKYDDDTWTLIRFRLKSGELRAPPAATRARFAQHVLELRRQRRVPAGFSLVVQPPFVVLGDNPPKDVRQSAQRTVGWAVHHLKRDFFAKDPDRVLDVWLFKNESSYRHHARQLFGSEPTTPYGYYSSSDDALVMNIATGGGTLVHEIVHPFIEANFPDCPAWFNEGLGSLYEQSAERDGQIVGLTNWRLAGLQRSIRRGTLPSFRTLTGTTSEQFYDHDPGTNYAEARYLLYYLQEEGLLRRYYREFTANVATDPTGYRTLARILGEPDMEKFQRRWERYVLSLAFP